LRCQGADSPLHLACYGRKLGAGNPSLLEAGRWEPILWLIGVDQDAGVVGAAHADLANWWPRVRAEFEGLPPAVGDLNVPWKGLTVVGLLFEGDRLATHGRGASNVCCWGVWPIRSSGLPRRLSSSAARPERNSGSRGPSTTYACEALDLFEANTTLLSLRCRIRDY
jgi:hypothetical protein